jgi:hypothetical protein
LSYQHTGLSCGILFPLARGVCVPLCCSFLLLLGMPVFTQLLNWRWDGSYWEGVPQMGYFGHLHSLFLHGVRRQVGWDSWRIIECPAQCLLHHLNSAQWLLREKSKKRNCSVCSLELPQTLSWPLIYAAKRTVADYARCPIN